MRPSPTPVLVIVDEGYYGHEAVQDELGPTYAVTVAEGLGGAIEALAALTCPIVLAPRTLAPDTGDAVLDALVAHRFDFVGVLMLDDDVPTASRGVHALIRRPLRPGAFASHIHAAASMRARLLEASARSHALARDIELLAHHLRHDLKGPVQSILGLLTLALEPAPATDRELLGRALRVTSRLGRQIDHVGDWLTLSRRPLEHAIIDLGELVAEAVAEVRLEHSDVALVTDTPTALRALVPGDGRALALALRRLLARAASLGPRVEVALMPTPHGWAIQVTDFGPRLSEATCSRLRDRFDSSEGEGLMAVAKVAERHDGLLSLRPLEPEGHVATLALPRAGGAVSDASVRETVRAPESREDSATVSGVSRGLG
jgi:signal transduction histidine kinase